MGRISSTEIPDALLNKGFVKEELDQDFFHLYTHENGVQIKLYPLMKFAAFKNSKGKTIAGRNFGQLDYEELDKFIKTENI